MRKVIIADDEPKVGELVCKLIQWEELDLELIGIFNDGQSAWDAICESDPDIVITDIRMPVISGLELVRLCFESRKNVHFIIISGYRYFEYAHTALKYGVEDYLLKPIDEKVLHEVLAHICNRETLQQEISLRVEEMQKQLESNRNLLEREFFIAMLQDPDQTASYKSINQKYGFSLESGLFRAIAVRVDRNIKAAHLESQEKLMMEKLEGIVSVLVREAGVTSVLMCPEGPLLLLLLNYRADQAEAVRLLSHNIMGRLREYCSAYCDHVPTLGISEQTEQDSRIPMLVHKAVNAVDNRILDGTNRRIKAAEIHCGKITAAQLLSPHKKHLVNYIETMQTDEVRRSIETSFDEAGKENAAGSVYYGLCGLLIGLLEENAALPVKVRAVWMEELHNLTSVADLQKHIIQLITDYLQEYAEKRREQESKPIREAMAYINKHYDQKILMEDIAKACFLNPTYFSELFKKETGHNFSDYLTEIRMDAAKEMLRDTRCPIYEIAEKVGYKDSKYFSQQFSRLVGIRPAEYRKLYL